MRRTAPPVAVSGRFAYEGLDRLLHEKARLGILTSLLSRPEGLVFNDLKQLCSLTDGNLSRHIQVLGDAGLVEISKGIVARRPQTLYRLTAHGRSRFRAYLAELERVIRDSLPAAEGAAQLYTRQIDNKRGCHHHLGNAGDARKRRGAATIGHASGARRDRC